MASGKAAKQVGEAIFKHVARKRAPSLFKKMLRSLDSGEYHVPKSFTVMSRFPSDELKLHHAPPLSVQLPENRIIQALQQELPEAKQEAVALSSVKPPLVRQLAWLRLQQQQQGQQQQQQQGQGEASVPQAAAAQGDGEVVEAKPADEEQALRARIRALGRSADVPSGHLGLLQAEEEIQLRAALDTLAGKGGPSGSAGGPAR